MPPPPLSKKVEIRVVRERIRVFVLEEGIIEELVTKELVMFLFVSSLLITFLLMFLLILFIPILSLFTPKSITSLYITLFGMGIGFLKKFNVG